MFSGVVLSTVVKMNMPGKVAIVTGASTGIGLQTALQLATRDEYEKIVLAVRSPDKTLRSIPAQLEGKTAVLFLDLASLDSVEQFVSNLALKGVSRIDRLVLNAGINDYTVKGRKKTVDGLDEIWQVNFLSHFYLCQLLKPLLAPGTRIVCLSSVMHWFGDVERFVDLVKEPANPRANVYSYADSKLAMAILAAELNRKNPEILAVAANPGSVASDIFRTWFVGVVGLILKFIAQLVLLTTADGATTSVFACTEESALKKFEYLSPYGQVKGWGWIVACLSDLYWFRVARNPKEIIGECASVVTEKKNGELLWTLAVEALSKTGPKRKRLFEDAT